jgi:serine/threonine-protein kinase
MATVFLGRALGAAGFERLVAIKCLHAHVAKDEDFVGMFMDEARLAARIRHPNVVPTLDLENGADGLFLVMEFVEGEGLLGLLRAVFKDRKRVPTQIALRIAIDVLAGLHAAHELTGSTGEPLRLVHRDVSPHNILVGIDGIARITDFGIARAEERLSVTRDGQIKGKIAYMAPEQTSGVPVDRRADLWSLGVVLWECLAGRRLFFGQNDGEVLRNLLVHPIPKLKELVPDVPTEIDAVLTRALSRDPDDRYATAAHFSDALEEAGGSVGIASARAVGTFVRDLAGARIAALQEAARAVVGDGNTSAIRALARERVPTDPERTNVRDDLKTSPPLPAAPQSVAPAAIAHQQKNTLPIVVVIFGATAFLVAIGLGGMWFMQKRIDSATRANRLANTDQRLANGHANADPQNNAAITPTIVVTTPQTATQADTNDAAIGATNGSNMVFNGPDEANSTTENTVQTSNSRPRTGARNSHTTGGAAAHNTGASTAGSATSNSTATQRNGATQTPFNPEAM